MDEDPPYLFPTWLVALLPGLFAWQFYGVWLAIAVFLAACFGLIGLGWAHLFRDWSWRRLVALRTGLIVLILVALSVSTAQTCNPDGSDCRSAFWPQTAG